VGAIREWLRPRIQDLAMGFMDELRPETVGRAEGAVLEVGFGTGRNLRYYAPGVKSLAALDPLPTGSIARRIEERIAAVSFPVERFELRADGELPFDAGRFDWVVTTWTLCSIPRPEIALAEMRRVLRPGGHCAFIEHGRSDEESTAAWQDRLNPLWRRIADGCNLNRPIDRLVSGAGFAMGGLERFRYKGPAILANMYRGVATRLE
jgi:SAM-dependent methyltransferase